MMMMIRAHYTELASGNSIKCYFHQVTTLTYLLRRPVVQ